MKGKYPAWSPYNYVLQNPARLVDTDGEAPGDPIFGIGINIRMNFSGGYSASVAMGASYKTGGFMSSVNVSVNAYNYGLGTVHGSSGKYVF